VLLLGPRGYADRRVRMIFLKVLERIQQQMPWALSMSGVFEAGYTFVTSSISLRRLKQRAGRSRPFKPLQNQHISHPLRPPRAWLADKNPQAMSRRPLVSDVVRYLQHCLLTRIRSAIRNFASLARYSLPAWHPSTLVHSSLTAALNPRTRTGLSTPLQRRVLYCATGWTRNLLEE
jgi:hypothetical protein